MHKKLLLLFFMIPFLAVGCVAFPEDSGYANGGYDHRYERNDDRYERERDRQASRHGHTRFKEA